MFWVGVCLGARLICVGISMVVGIFVGEILGAGYVLVGWLEGLVLLGRAWVSSLPIFFLGNSFQFWKLPPPFCINNMDNVSYPIFLT